MISRLSLKLRTATGAFAADIRSLELNIQPRWEFEYPDLSLIKCTPSLKHLRLFMDYSPLERDSSFTMRHALHSMAGSLETLIIYVFDNGDYNQKAGMGSLRALTSLKRLCIQLPVLVGKPVKARNDLKISNLLPPGLQKLEVHCPTKRTDFEEGGPLSPFGRGKLVNTSLTSFTGKDTKHERVLDSVVICICEAMLYGEESHRYMELIKSRLDVMGVEKSEEDTRVMVRPDLGHSNKTQWMAFSIS